MAADNPEKKISKIFYKCNFDPEVCNQRFDAANKIVDHICKYHLGKIELARVDVKNEEPPNRKQNLSKIFFGDVFIVIYFSYRHKI